MKSVLISIRPKWCELIASGRETLDIRKTRPKLPTPFKCYIYCTKQKAPGEILLTYDKHVVGRNKGFRENGDIPLAGKIIGEFMCDEIDGFDVPYPTFQRELDKAIMNKSCLTYYELHRYAYHDRLYGWHISDLKIYDAPKALCKLKKINRECWYADLGLAKRDCPECKNTDCFLTRPPQSWCYVENLEETE